MPRRDQRNIRQPSSLPRQNHRRGVPLSTPTIKSNRRSRTFTGPHPNDTLAVIKGALKAEGFDSRILFNWRAEGIRAFRRAEEEAKLTGKETSAQIDALIKSLRAEYPCFMPPTRTLKGIKTYHDEKDGVYRSIASGEVIEVVAVTAEAQAERVAADKAERVAADEAFAVCLEAKYGIQEVQPINPSTGLPRIKRTVRWSQPGPEQPEPQPVAEPEPQQPVAGLVTEPVVAEQRPVKWDIYEHIPDEPNESNEQKPRPDKPAPLPFGQVNFVIGEDALQYTHAAGIHAQSKAGKSVLSMNLVDSYAAYGHGVYYSYFEMNETAYREMLRRKVGEDARLSGEPVKDAHHADITFEDGRRLGGTDRIKRLIEAWAAAADSGVSIFFLDNLQLAHDEFTEATRDRATSLGKFSDVFVEFARLRNVLVWILLQENRPDPRFHHIVRDADAIEGSSRIKANVDFLFGLTNTALKPASRDQDDVLVDALAARLKYLDGEHTERRPIEMILRVTANRHGAPDGEFPLIYNGKAKHMRELTREETVEWLQKRQATLEAEKTGKSEKNKPAAKPKPKTPLQLALEKHGEKSVPKYLRNALTNAKQRVREAAEEGKIIPIHPLWVADPNEFYCYVLDNLGPKPEPHPTYGRYSFDKMVNDLGYIPGNVQWAHGTAQIENRGPNLTETANS